MFEIKDSGSREEFSTGSKRDVQTGKPRYELIPIEPLHDLAMHYTNGAVKYGDDNWRKGQPIKRMFASLLRHTYAYLAGADDGEDHGAAIAWNSFAIKWTRLQIKAGLLPESLEDVFTDEQFKESYGRCRCVDKSCVPAPPPSRVPRHIPDEQFQANPQAPHEEMMRLGYVWDGRLKKWTL
jgi:hypothetical protein